MSATQGTTNTVPYKRKSARLRNVIGTSFEALPNSYKGYDIPATGVRLAAPRKCPHCVATLLQFEPRGFCCLSGKVRLVLPDTPLPLYELFSANNSISAAFRKYIRAYNNAFAFTSMGVRRDSSLMEQNAGIYTFRIQGQLYHSISSLAPSATVTSPLQLYFHDTDNELSNRVGSSVYLLPEIIQLLDSFMAQNPYAVFFRSLRSFPHLDSVSISLATDPAQDQRVYNQPSVAQVAALWLEDGANGDNFARSIVLHGLDSSVHPIYHNYGCYDALQYPLLFPRGEVGWHPSIQLNSATTSLVLRDTETIASFLARQRAASALAPKKVRISCRDYYCYKLQIRSDARNVLLISGRLFQQFVVDMYVKIETGRLQYIRQNQKKLRADLYQGLVDATHAGTLTGSDVGRRVVLPATFIGGPRDMRRRFLDAMALVRQFGKPDLFITITCNPSWQEIQEQLSSFEHSQNRPDIVSRVFRAKLELLKVRIVDEAFFGPVAAYVYVVEFQKRGLPHAHFLVILQSQHKIRSANQIDKFVSAELPSETQQPRLHSLVVKHMMHGPCGSLNPRNVCMGKKGTCKNKYPRPFSEVTEFGDDSFPNYQRPSNGPSVRVRSAYLDNSWVVPYNPLLLAEFDCHLNVEVCSSIKAVKYLYKYIYKGHDRIRFGIDTGHVDAIHDEVSAFQDARWISPPEATWRIFAFLLNEMYPHVYGLQVHLPGHHDVHFHESANLANVLQSSNTARTMLTEYFALNSVDAFSCTLLYKQIPEHYVWDRPTKTWARRKNKVVIGRLVSVGIAEGERYYLRLLLTHVRGATSFESLRTVRQVLCSTFRQACMLSGFLQDDDHHVLCFDEAAQYGMPSQLRQLFAIVLAYGSLQDPRGLWLKFKGDMIADFILVHTDIAIAEKAALQQVQISLDAVGKDINDYSVVEYHVSPLQFADFHEQSADNLYTNEPDYNSSNLLNDQQRLIFDATMAAVMNGTPLCVFVDGPGGTGKTFLYKSILAHVKARGSHALPVASSGVAAALLPGGRTAHNRFKIPLAVQEHMQCSISKQSIHADVLRRTTLFIWDEAPMMHRFSVECVDRLLRDITDVDLPFGGKIFVFGGDFRQVLPVLPRATKEQTCQASLVYSYLWPHFLKYTLSLNMRALLDPHYSTFLLRIGNGELCSDSSEMIQLPSALCIDYVDELLSLKQLCHAVFPETNNWSDVYSNYQNHVLLTPKNDSVDLINQILLDELPGDSYKYYSNDELLECTDHTFEIDFLNTLAPPGLPLHELQLKKDCPLILLRNLSSADGLCNGTRLIAKQFRPNLIEAIITTGDKSEMTVFIPRITFLPAESQETVYSFKRTQFPVKLCFAMTINKAQGQTLDFVGIYLKEPVFAHGQLYVGLSRVKSSKSIKVLICPTDQLLKEGYTLNIVYKELLCKVI